MKRWNVSASVTVDINVEVEAESSDEAERLLESHLSMTANMVDMDTDKFEVWDDCIEAIGDVEISVAPKA